MREEENKDKIIHKNLKKIIKTLSGSPINQTQIIEYLNNLRGLQLKFEYSNQIFEGLSDKWGLFDDNFKDLILDSLNQEIKQSLFSILKNHKKNKDFCMKIIEKHGNFISKKTFFDILGDPELAEFLKDYLKKYLKSLPKDMLKSFINYAIDYNAFEILSFIKSLDQTLFEEITAALPQDRKNNMESIISRCSPILSKYTLCCTNI